MTQRDLARKLSKAPSYVHKCEVAERKMDPLEFLDWVEACGLKPVDAYNALHRVR